MVTITRAAHPLKVWRRCVSPSAAALPPAPLWCGAWAAPYLWPPAPEQPPSSATGSPNAPCHGPLCPAFRSLSSEREPAASDVGPPEHSGEKSAHSLVWEASRSSARGGRWAPLWTLTPTETSKAKSSISNPDPPAQLRFLLVFIYHWEERWQKPWLQVGSPPPLPLASSSGLWWQTRSGTSCPSALCRLSPALWGGSAAAGCSSCGRSGVPDAAARSGAGVCPATEGQQHGQRDASVCCFKVNRWISIMGGGGGTTCLQGLFSFWLDLLRMAAGQIAALACPLRANLLQFLGLLS